MKEGAAVATPAQVDVWALTSISPAMLRTSEQYHSARTAQPARLADAA